MTEMNSTQSTRPKGKVHPTKRMLRADFDYDCEKGMLVWKRDLSQSRKCKKRAGTYAGYDTGNGYVVVREGCTGGWSFFAHRLIWIWHHGPIPDGLQVDHLNGIKNDNRIENLPNYALYVVLSF